MAEYNVNTGSAGTVRLTITDSAGDPGGNNSRIDWSLRFIERTASNTTFANDIPFSVGLVGTGTISSGTFDFDWRGAGLQSTVIASGAFTYHHNDDGTGNVVLSVSTGSTGTSGGGSGVAFQGGVTPDTLVAKPGTISSLVATRVSDTQTSLKWVQNNPSNGLPTHTGIGVSRNGGASDHLVDMGGAKSATVSAAANQKLVYHVSSSNSAGTVPTEDSNTIYTTPAAPTSVKAAKTGSSTDILISWTPKVGYLEYNNRIWHGVVATDGTITWDASLLIQTNSATTSYTHVAPDASKVHVYRIQAVAGALTSAYGVSNSVQLQAAPNKPIVPAMPANTDRALATVYAWTHNPVDTSPQSAYEFQTSLDGGTTWTGTGKVASAASTYTVAANTQASGTVQTTRVRTWGSATTGGADGAGASPWSDIRTVTYKTKPTATITLPTTGSTLTDAVITVNLGFAQIEGASFVQGQIQLLQAGTVIEDDLTGDLLGNVLDTPGDNGAAYTLQARTQDSNGLWSAWTAPVSFSVAFLVPAPAVSTVTYLVDSGFAQIDLDIGDADDTHSAAVTVTITRAIDGVTETLVQDYPAASELSFLDTTPTVHGTNTYTITTSSASGAQSVRHATLVTTELRRAYLSKGAAYDTVLVFGGNLSIDETLTVASATVQASGRTKPIGLYSNEQTVQLKVQSYIFENFGSTLEDARSILLIPGKACYRDPSGRRVFGSVTGGISRSKVARGNLTFTLTETS